jgi:hypothetical protein
MEPNGHKYIRAFGQKRWIDENVCLCLREWGATGVQYVFSARRSTSLFEPERMGSGGWGEHERRAPLSDPVNQYGNVDKADYRLGAIRLHKLADPTMQCIGTLMLWFWAAALVLDTAHSLAPVILVCSHPGLREIAVQRWRRCIAFPALLFMLAQLTGVVTVCGFTSYDLQAPHQLWRITDFFNPLPVMFWIYWIWNAYHFGMQNFGVARLFHLPGPRWLHKAGFGGGTATIMLAGAHVFGPALGFIVGTIFISFGHWLSELWLTWRAIGYRWVFIAGILAVGLLGFIWSEPTEYGLAMTASGFFLVLYVCRLGIGFVHFTTDRWIWKLSDPQIKSAMSW